MNRNVCGAPVENGVCTYCGAVVGSPQEASGMQQPGMGQTWQMNPMQNNVSMKPIKSKTTTLILAIFLGWFGVHRYYVGKIGTGLLYTFTIGIFYIGWIVDIVKIASNTFQDSEGRIIR